MTRILFLHRNSENLGISYLSSCLKKAGHKTELLFDPDGGEYEYPILKRFEFFGYKQIDEGIEKFKPDLILFSSMTNLFPWVLKYASYIKKKYNLTIGVGGIHPTVAQDYVLSKPFVDFICVGEGEEAIVEVANTFDGKFHFEDIKNISYKKNGQIIKNKLRPLIDLNKLPFPDKDLFYKFGTFSYRYYLMTSRGCPFVCSYCVNHQLRQIYKGLGNYIRRRAPKNVIDELIWAKKRYNFKEVFFYDDIFTMDEKWLQEFVDELSKLPFKFKYKCLVSTTCVTEGIAKLLKKSGCIDVDIGVESGSERIRKEIYNKTGTNKQILNATAVLKKYGIRVCTLNIIYAPTETPEDMFETFSLNYQIKPSGAVVTSLYPFPNTKIFERCKEEKLINTNSSEAIFTGEGSYKKDIIFKHPYENIGKRIQIFLPLFIKLPKWTHYFMFKIPPIKLFRILIIPLLTSPHNAVIKISEFFKMFLISYIYYKKNK
ncbi:B12-binding domain-containing radical SAM protein [Patescibacteria group bacterium]|nr:B12-binding domain-containing radical SAM protein [Patescibacteria group bacterium]